MRVLLRILSFAFFIWFICYFFYSLGRKRTLGDQKRKGQSPPTKRKRVDSTVVENDCKWTSRDFLCGTQNAQNLTVRSPQAI